MSSNDHKEIDEITGTDTTGHDWDGIKELNNPLPRWWLWCFYITIVWGIAYTIAYPAWPLISSTTSARARATGAISAIPSASDEPRSSGHGLIR